MDLWHPLPFCCTFLFAVQVVLRSFICCAKELCTNYANFCMHYWCNFAIFVHKLLILTYANYDNDKRIIYFVSINVSILSMFT